jgi:hypothetical protein
LFQLGAVPQHYGDQFFAAHCQAGCRIFHRDGGTGFYIPAKLLEKH